MGAFYQHGFCYAKTLVENLSITSWNPCGVLHMDTSTEDQQRHQAIAARHPETFADYKNGLLEPTAGFLSPPEFCGTLLKQKNIETRFLEKIKSLPEGFDAIVIACGNDSKNFPETEWLPLQSLRGQISFVQATPASEKLEHVICHDGYIIPAQGGIHCIGATFQKEATVNFDIREEDHAENIEKLHQYLPHFNISLRNITGGRVGYRATTPDKLPMIGPLPNYAATLSAFEGLKNGKEIDAPVPYLPRIYLSTGFGAHGLSAAPIAGEIVAGMISDDPLPLPQSLMAHLLPERFILRDLKRKRT
jgi:tRNA 5-methylaminomethyl-2-thiouridine biosynthesis bifunctional protein